MGERRNSGGWVGRRSGSRLLVMSGMAVVFAMWGGVGPVRGEVKDATEHGFHVVIEREVAAEFAVAYVVFYASVGEWWSSSHTWSGDSKNLSIEAKAGGLFSEALPNNGSVKHMEVIFAAPGKSLRMTGALGPLQEQAVTGVMTVTFTEAGEGKTKVVLDYRVGGYIPGGAKVWAEPVDGVLTDALDRLQRYIATGKADE